jgi:ribose 5-phosphate isomerase A
MPIDRQAQQRAAAERAVQYVESGMVIGLGSGATASFAVRKLAENLRSGTVRDVCGVPSSESTAALARELDVPLTTLDAHAQLDLTIDGADEVDPALNLIKGAGGALLREKILAQASARLIIVVDESKLSPRLGLQRALPVEVVMFGWRSQQRYLESLGAEVALRSMPDGRPFQTDNGNLILDCSFGELPDAELIATRLRARAGVVEHGLFIGLATDLISGGPEGPRHATRSAQGNPEVQQPEVRP